MSLFAQGSNKNFIKSKASQKKHITQREHKKLKTRKNYKVKELYCIKFEIRYNNKSQI